MGVAWFSSEIIISCLFHFYAKVFQLKGQRKIHVFKTCEHSFESIRQITKESLTFKNDIKVKNTKMYSPQTIQCHGFNCFTENQWTGNIAQLKTIWAGNVDHLRTEI